MTTFRLTLAAKRDRARIAAVARPKAREETPKKGRHDRYERQASVAYRSGQSREVRAFGKAEVALDRHAASNGCGRRTSAGHSAPSGQLAENHAIARS